MTARSEAPAVDARGLAIGELAADVRDGLGRGAPKSLPSKWLYDDVGSALFEAICRLPEYGLTRADERILVRHAADVTATLGGPRLVAELGSGSGRKTRPLLEAAARHGAVTYVPIDISAAALEACQASLDDLGGVRVAPHLGDYLEGLHDASARRRAGERLLVLFLGSTIGNFDRTAGQSFLRDLRRALRPGDGLLLGTDLEKPVEVLRLAYDDPAGVTAAFDRNLLARLNRELGADFDLSRFVHEARWNHAARRIEMHLRSIREQTVTIPGARLQVRFARDETIWTESSHKYRRDEALELGARAGFEAAAQWFDDEWPFAETLLRPV